MSFRKKQRRFIELKEKVVDLNITPMMSLMVVLIPVLLYGAKYSLLSEYEISTNAPIVSEVTPNKIILFKYKLILEKNRIIFKNKKLVLLDVTTDNKNEALSILDSELRKLKNKGTLDLSLNKNLKYKYVVNFLDVINNNKKNISNISISVRKING